MVCKTYSVWEAEGQSSKPMSQARISLHLWSGFKSLIAPGLIILYSYRLAAKQRSAKAWGNKMTAPPGSVFGVLRIPGGSFMAHGWVM
jgi:hypothetical protein